MNEWISVWNSNLIPIFRASSNSQPPIPIPQQNQDMWIFMEIFFGPVLTRNQTSRQMKESELTIKWVDGTQELMSPGKNDSQVILLYNNYSMWNFTFSLSNVLIPIHMHLIPIPIPRMIVFQFPWESHGTHGIHIFPIPMHISRSFCADVYL